MSELYANYTSKLLKKNKMGGWLCVLSNPNEIFFLKVLIILSNQKF